MSGKGFSQSKDTKGGGSDDDDRHHKRKNEDDDDDDEEGAGGKGDEKKQKTTIGALTPISMKLGPFQKASSGTTAKGNELKTTAKKVATGGLVANVFGNDDDDEEEEMPPEAKMRMRNMGRDTPTSTGPNSFGKTRQGFCDSRKGFEKGEKKTPNVVPGRRQE